MGLACFRPVAADLNDGRGRFAARLTGLRLAEVFLAFGAGRFVATRRFAALGRAALRALAFGTAGRRLRVEALARAGLRAGLRLVRLGRLDFAAMWTTPLPLVDLGC